MRDAPDRRRRAPSEESPWSHVRDGALRALPVTPGVLPFAFVTGLAARDAGHGLVEAFGLSVFLYAGASQLATLELLREGAPLWVIVLTVGALNSRMMMYSATLAPSFVDTRLRTRLAIAYQITDHAFALSAAEFASGRRTAIDDRLRFYGGLVAVLWSVWQVGTLAGVLLASLAPEGFPIHFAGPVMFLALLGANVADWPRVAAATVAGVTTLVLLPMPANIGMPIGAALGITTGTVLTLRRQGRAERITEREVEA